MSIEKDLEDTDGRESYILILYNKLRINIFCFMEKEINLQKPKLIYTVMKNLAVTILLTELAGRLKEYKRSVTTQLYIICHII
jgi:hypothetical protein